MSTKKSWDEFRETGLLLFINLILHAFGWIIIVAIDSSEKVIDVYPARTKYRGFSDSSVSKSYKKIAKYLKENADELFEEILP